MFNKFDIQNSHEHVKASYDEAKIKLANAEVQIEDLKLQLDDALTAEDMLVRLTERNLVLGEVKLLLSMDDCVILKNSG